MDCFSVDILSHVTADTFNVVHTLFGYDSLLLPYDFNMGPVGQPLRPARCPKPAVPFVVLFSHLFLFFEIYPSTFLDFVVHTFCHDFGGIEKSESVFDAISSAAVLCLVNVIHFALVRFVSAERNYVTMTRKRSRLAHTPSIRVSSVIHSGL